MALWDHRMPGTVVGLQFSPSPVKWLPFTKAAVQPLMSSGRSRCLVVAAVNTVVYTGRHSCCGACSKHVLIIYINCLHRTQPDVSVSIRDLH